MAAIQIDRVKEVPAVQMIWGQFATPAEITHAFQQINHLLNLANESLFVIVDIRSNPNFPLSATINSALFGPYRNPALREWLIIGSNPLAHTIERILSGVTGRGNIRWFADDIEVSGYLAQFTPAQH